MAHKHGKPSKPEESNKPCDGLQNIYPELNLSRLPLIDLKVSCLEFSWMRALIDDSLSSLIAPICCSR